MADLPETQNTYTKVIVMKLSPLEDSKYRDGQMRLVISPQRSFLETWCFKETGSGRKMFQFFCGHLNDEQPEALRTMFNEYHDSKDRGNGA